jgi:hypothetical protein
MDISTEAQPVLNEEIWRAWIQKGKRREESAARKFKIVAGIVLLALALGTAIYLFAL